MEILALLLIWPFLILALGLVFVAGTGSGAGIFPAFSGFFWTVLIIILLILYFRNRKHFIQQSAGQQLEFVRKLLVTFSIALLIPIFLRYLTGSLNHSLLVILIGLLAAFGLILWTLTARVSWVLLYANIGGAVLALLYLYQELWQLGDLARILAAAFGLIIAVVIAVVKLKDKLV